MQLSQVPPNVALVAGLVIVLVIGYEMFQAAKGFWTATYTDAAGEKAADAALWSGIRFAVPGAIMAAGLFNIYEGGRASIEQRLIGAPIGLFMAFQGVRSFGEATPAGTDSSQKLMDNVADALRVAVGLTSLYVLGVGNGADQLRAGGRHAK
jgi:hypothetical protein